MAILDAAFRYVRPCAAFCRLRRAHGVVARPLLDRIGPKAERLGTAFGNIPPATVCRLRPRQPS